MGHLKYECKAPKMLGTLSFDFPVCTRKIIILISRDCWEGPVGEFIHSFTHQLFIECLYMSCCLQALGM